MTTDLTNVRFVPDGFAAPHSFEHALFTLRPLDVEHNERDYAAWTTSLEHIASTPGFNGANWPHPMRLDENRSDLARHAADFAARRGFTYTVLDGDDVIGCVYIYPSKEPAHDVKVSSWVRRDRAQLDAVLYRVVLDWLARDWPFRHVEYAPRATAE